MVMPVKYFLNAFVLMKYIIVHYNHVFGFQTCIHRVLAPVMEYAAVNIFLSNSEQAASFHRARR